MHIFDIETNGYLDETTTIHCINDFDTETQKHTRYDPISLPIELGIKRLSEADIIVGHNIFGFDIPAIQKLYPGWTYKNAIDTLPLARLCFPTIKQSDFGRYQQGIFPPGKEGAKLIGKHSLEAWGYRLGVLKGTFAKTTDWQRWTPAMSDYCEQDVVVNIRLYEVCMKKKPSKAAWDLENQVQYITDRQVRNGFGFDIKAAEALYEELVCEREKVLREIHDTFHPFYKRASKKVFVPKRDNKRLGYTAGAACSKIQLVDFSPTSGQHVYVMLRKEYGWEPTEFTDKSKMPEQYRYLFADYYKQLGIDKRWPEPKISDEILEKLEFPLAKPIGRAMMLQKRISQLADGDQGWMKHYKDGRIHGAVNTLGTRTRRMTHFYPNLAQVPANYSPYGPECRALFIPRPGWVQVGYDASGLEARVQAHFVWPFDQGVFAKQILEGKKEDGTDLHSVNAGILSLSRDDAKTWYYAWLYGAGNAKLGAIAKRNAQYGKKMREKFEREQPALGKLVQLVKARVKKRGFLLSLDKQVLVCPSEHSALNTICQSAGAVVMKKAKVICDAKLQAAGLIPGVNYEFMGDIHDEHQIECEPEHAEFIGQTGCQSITDAGNHFNFRIELKGDYDIGKSWKECH